jgi:hypothetical protein
MIQIASTLAIVTGLAGLLPQIYAMTSTRSSLGQSAVGWGLGIGVNALMAYVNLVGYGAKALAVGNLLGLGLCMAAFAAVMRFRPQLERAQDVVLEAPVSYGLAPMAEDRPVPTAVRPAGGADPVALTELPTREFFLVKQEFEHEEARRFGSQHAEVLAAA